MKDLMIFKNEDFNVRVHLENGKYYFNLSDLCRTLGLRNPSTVMESLDKDGIIKKEYKDRMGRTVLCNAVNESNMYQVIFQSRKPEARKFTHWVTSEVLPSIRKTGMYGKHDFIKMSLEDPGYVINLLKGLVTEREENKRLSEKCAFVDHFMGCNEAILVREYAKLLSNKGEPIGEKHIYRWLRENGYLMDNNEPYQRYMDQGLFKVKETLIEKPNNSFLSFTTMITPKGQQYFYNKLKGELYE